MQGMNINDWQTIQTRNYVKSIKETVVASKPTDWAILLDIFLLFVSFMLDRIFADSPICISRSFWIIFLSIGSFLTIGIVVFLNIRRAHIKSLQKILPPHEIIVTTFDEEVCYKLMSAVSFIGNLQDLKESSKFESSMDKSLARFYFAEIIYYLNKAIDILSKFENSLSDVLVLESNEASIKNLGIDRVENVCELIDSIYTDLQEYTSDAVLSIQSSALNKNKEKYKGFKGSLESAKSKLIENEKKSNTKDTK